MRGASGEPEDTHASLCVPLTHACICPFSSAQNTKLNIIFRKKHTKLSNALSSIIYYGLPGGSVVKNPPTNAGDIDLIPGLGRSPREGNGNPLQYSCLENPMDRGTWVGYSPCFHKESDTTEHTCIIYYIIQTICKNVI